MKKSRFSEDQMVKIPPRGGSSAGGRSGQATRSECAWRKGFGWLEPADVKRLRQIEHENGLSKKLVAERDLFGPDPILRQNASRS